MKALIRELVNLVYSDFWDIIRPYHACPKIGKVHVTTLLCCSILSQHHSSPVLPRRVLASQAQCWLNRLSSRLMRLSSNGLLWSQVLERVLYLSNSINHLLLFCYEGQSENSGTVHAPVFPRAATFTYYT